MTVYVDVLVVLNIFVNYFLLSGASLILRKHPKRIFLVLGAFLGGLYSLIIFLPEIPDILSILMNIAASSIIVSATFLPRRIKEFFKEFAAFFAVNFLFAGLMLAVWILFKPKGMVYNNSAVYFNIDIKILVFSTIGCYIVLTIFSKILKRSAPSDKLYDVEISHKGRMVMTKALFDTGNTLSDGFSNTPVIVAQKSVVKKLVSPSLYEYFDGNAALPIDAGGEKIRLIPFGSVGGNGMLKAVIIDEVKIPKENITAEKVILAQSNNDFNSTEYSVLLGTQIFNDEEGKKHNEHHKKVITKN